MGVNLSKSEENDLELLDILQQTNNMTADAARKQYEEFVESSAARIDGVIYRLKHHYNIGKRINSINKQSLLSVKTVNKYLRGKGLITAEEQMNRDKKEAANQVLGKVQAGIEQAVNESIYGN